MESLFESGRLVDLILTLMLVEALILSGLAVARRGRIPLAGLLFNLAAGACLLLALRAVLTGAGWVIAGFWLAMALMAHLSDLIHRLRG